MFNLDEAITEWRRQMAADGNKNATILDELESHLREDICARLEAGDSETRAFVKAFASIGNPSVVRKEFNKISRTPGLPVKIGTSLWIVQVVLMAILWATLIFTGKATLLLATYLFILTTGYGAIFLIGGLALYYFYSQWLGKLSPALEQSLTRAVRQFTGIAATFVLVGFSLGMIWSWQKYGSYWENSPREIGSLCASAWLTALWAIQHLNKASVRVRMLAGVGGNVIVTLAWFGALILTGDPHLSRFRYYWPLEIFVAAHFVILALAGSRKLKPVQN
jgi:hypothetical protein